MTAESADHHTSAADSELARRAMRTWRRAGVRPADRRELRDDLLAELAGVRAAGLSDHTVLGADPVATARRLAQECGVSGQSPRLARFVIAAFAGSLLGSAPVLMLIGAEFSNGSATPWDWPLLLYPTAALLAYGLALAAVGAALYLVDDNHVRRSVRTLAVTLPLTALAATAAGTGTAALQHYQTRPAVFLSCSAVVLVIYVLGCVAARLAAIRPAPSPGESSPPLISNAPLAR